jgi:predicted RecA/RadA family phage recombinase
MATNFVQEGKNMVMSTVTGAESGDAFVVGDYLPCVLLTDAGTDSPYNATVQTEGVFELSVTGNDGASPAAISIGDMLYWTDKDTALDVDTSESPFGIALEAVGSGDTETIKVLLTPKAVMPASVGTSDLEAAAVETAKIKDKNVTGAKLADAIQDSLITFDIASVDGTDGTAAVTIQAQDSEGNNLAENVLIRAWTAETSMGAAHAMSELAVAADALIITEHLANAIVDIMTDATGEAVLTVTDANGTVYLMIECQGTVTATAVTITGN